MYSLLAYGQRYKSTKRPCMASSPQTVVGGTTIGTGACWDLVLMNVKQIMDHIAITLGRRVREELHFDTVTSGALDDFNKVTRTATAIATK